MGLNVLKQLVGCITDLDIEDIFVRWLSKLPSSMSNENYPPKPLEHKKTEVIVITDDNNDSIS